MANRRIEKFIIKVASNKKEILVQEALTKALHDNPIPLSEQKWNLPLFLNRQALSKILGMGHLYQMILPVTGVIMEFGFDEINDSIYPGETRALMEVLGLGRYPLKRNPYYVTSNHLVIE